MLLQLCSYSFYFALFKHYYYHCVPIASLHLDLDLSSHFLFSLFYLTTTLRHRITFCAPSFSSHRPIFIIGFQLQQSTVPVATFPFFPFPPVVWIFFSATFFSRLPLFYSIISSAFSCCFRFFTFFFRCNSTADIGTTFQCASEFRVCFTTKKKLGINVTRLQQQQHWRLAKYLKLV